MLTCVCDVALAMILYLLLKPVSKNLALLAAFFQADVRRDLWRRQALRKVAGHSGPN